MKNKFIVSMVLIFLPTSSQAEIIALSIPSFNGNYEYFDSRTVSFDMGVSFSSIKSASIKLNTRGIHGLAEVCTFSVFDAWSSFCMSYIDYSKAFYRIGSENTTEPGDLLIVDYTLLEPEGWHTTSVALAKTDHLLDGKATLTLGHAKTDFFGNVTLSSHFYASDISIEIDGVVSSDTAIPSSDCIETPGIGTVSSNLDIHIPVMVFESPENNIITGIDNESPEDNNIIELDLEYLGLDSEDKHVWGYKNHKVNDSSTCSEIEGTGIIQPTWDLFIPSLNLETLHDTQNIWGELMYLGTNSAEQHLWQLKDYGFNQ